MDDTKEPALSFQSILKYLSTLQPETIQSDAERSEVLEALAAAQSRLETPWETARKICLIQPMVSPVLTVCVDVDLFRKWVEERDAEPLPATELAKLTGVDSTVLEHLLRQLAAQRMLHVQSPGVYSLTPFTRVLTKRPWTGMLPWLNEFANPGSANFPAYLRAHSYGPPPSAPTNWEHFRGRPFFDDCEHDRTLFQGFHDGMGLLTASKVPWTSLVPPEHLLTDAYPDAPLVVDVGGGQGVDIEHIRQAVPAEWYPCLILQDLPSSVAAVSLHEGVKKMGHDFFTPQPIKSSRAYYMHAVLHDWPDDKVVKILKHLADAMEEGYSSLLIHEIVVGDEPGVMEMTIDMYVWMNFGAGERTEVKWRELAERAGLEVVKIWRGTGSFESVIEAKKKKASVDS